jgi:sugar O-acyltransferase (sialic acid O-acetyltransferase NeuD family)
MRRLYLCGAGNAEGVRLAIRVNQRERLWDELVLLDDDPSKRGALHLGVPVEGPFADLALADPAHSHAVNLVARTTAGRRAVRERIAAYGIPFAPLISGDVDLLGAETGGDLLAYPNATVGPEARIGDGCVVFMGSAVGHESWVGDHCVLAANSVLNARVRLGDGVYVGSGAVVLPEVEIGDGATIGAGAVVIGDVPAGATVVARAAEMMRGGMRADAPRLPQDVTGELGKLWCEVLGVHRLEPGQNFFDAGGTSLLALRLLQRIEASMGVSLRPIDLYQYPSLAAMAMHVSAMDCSNSPGDDDDSQPMLRARYRRQMMAARAAR